MKFIEKLKSSTTPSCYCFGNSDDPNEKGYDRIAHKFAIGSNGQLINIDQLKTFEIDAPVIVRGNSKSKVEAIDVCKNKGYTWYNIDTGYLGNGTLKHYHRIAKNNYQNLEELIDRPRDRLDKISYKIKKQTSGKNILLCPPSEKVMSIYGLDLDKWVNETIEEIKKYTDRNIVVRIKKPRKDRVSFDPITLAFDRDVHCVVTYNSIAALEAVMHGKPAITLGPNAAQSVCSQSLSEIENPYYPSEDQIDQLLRHLSYCQFTEVEFKNGTAWSIINEGS